MTTNPRLKITDVVSVPLRLVETVGEMEAAWNPGTMWSRTIGGGSFVEVHTDQGLVGIGPGVSPALIPAVKERLLGEDPFDVERHSHVLRYYATGLPYQGTAGIDIALWDLIGKASGQPLYKLWGGGRDKVMPYASLILLSTPEERAEMAIKLMEEGWKALKIRAHYQTLAEDIRLVEIVREAVGDAMEIMVDGNQAFSGIFVERLRLPKSLKT
jgi:L-alanine-DL-glutamate epimerase-like enolase superfamily enzyme